MEDPLSPLWVLAFLALYVGGGWLIERRRR
jgi:paraquat-inducible protein B